MLIKKTVCFCGLDGVGKTTQAKVLITRLRKTGQKPVYIHLFSKKGTVGSRFQQIPFLAKIVSFIRQRKNTPGGIYLNITTRMFNVFLDSWITTIVNKIKHQGKIIIYDRYFYDILVILAAEYPRLSTFILNLVHFLPKPKLVFIFSKNYKKSNLYLDLAKKIKVEVIKVKMSREKISDQIYEKLLL